MKTSVLLIADSRGDSNVTVAAAATLTERGFRHVDNSQHAFKLFRNAVHDVDLVIIDLDPGIHSMAVLEAISWCENLPPVIAITGLEEEYMSDIARRHGAAACIGKPFTAPQLARLIDEVCAAGMLHALSCDAWGHPQNQASSPMT